MPLPTKTDLLKMDYSFRAEPFVFVPAKSDINLATMDYSFRAESFVANPDTVRNKDILSLDSMSLLDTIFRNKTLTVEDFLTSNDTILRDKTIIIIDLASFFDYAEGAVDIVSLVDLIKRKGWANILASVTESWQEVEADNPNSWQNILPKTTKIWK